MANADAERDFHAQVARQRAECFEILKSLGVLNGLSAEQQRTLVAEVVQYPHYDALYQRDEDRRHWQKREPGQIRKLLRKLNKARRELEDLFSAARAIAIPDAAGKLNRVLLRRLDVDLFPHVTDAIRALERATLPDPQAIDREVDEAGTADMRVAATNWLMDFFERHCGLPKNDAEVRAAKIGNTLLGWNVAVREQYDGIVGWKGADAIRKRRSRQTAFRRPRTIRQKHR